MAGVMMMPGMSKSLIQAQAKKTKNRIELEKRVQEETSATTTTTTTSNGKEKAKSNEIDVESDFTPLPKFDLRNIEDVRKMTHHLNLSHSIKYMKQDAATPEQCLALLLSEKPNDTITGLVGVATEHNYTKRLKDGAEFVTHLEEGTVYQHEIIPLGCHSFDYTTNISLVVYFDDEQFKGEGDIPDHLEKDVEIFLVCCNYTVYSTKLTLTRKPSGSVIGTAIVLKMPNFLPIRHTTYSLPSRLMIRERGRLVSQVDVAMHNVIVRKLLPEHWFMTPAHLPICVKQGMCIFQRQTFLDSIPKEFLHRYELRNKDIKDNYY